MSPPLYRHVPVVADIPELGNGTNVGSESIGFEEKEQGSGGGKRRGTADWEGYVKVTGFHFPFLQALLCGGLLIGPIHCNCSRIYLVLFVTIAHFDHPAWIG